MTSGTPNVSGRSAKARLYTALATFGVMFVVLFVVLPFTIDIVIPVDLFYSASIESSDGIRLQEKYGFALEMRRIVVGEAGQQALPVISQVAPDGTMSRLGIQPGDVVMCIPWGRAGFWNELLMAERGYEARLHVARPEHVARGCGAAREVVLPGRPRPMTL